MNLKLNTILKTKDGRKIGNAIVIELLKVDGMMVYRIRTDYGNTALLIIEEIEEIFYIEQDDNNDGFSQDPHKYAVEIKGD